MKTRTGFVSNSSSSSFVCDVCGEECSGYDMGLDEAGMVQCVNGHTFCEGHRLNQKNEDKDQDEVLDENDECDDDSYDLPDKDCPLCQFQKITDDDLSTWLLLQVGTTREKVLAELREQFKDYKAFQVESCALIP